MVYKMRWLILAAGLGLSACQTATPPAEMAEPEIAHAVAVLYPTAGNQTQGIVHFTQTSEGIQVTAEVHGLAPGVHGFHIHEWGDCSAPDATSAGGHFNPTQQPHGSPDSPQRHVGDLGNLEVGADSTARYSRLDTLLAFTGPRSIIGRAVVVHASADDLTSQPAGNAGGRLACGVIGVAQAAAE